MRCERDGFSIDAALDKGRDLPDWFLEEPPLLPGDQFYLDAFWDLSTCRPVGMSEGPIPWTSIVEYWRMSGLDDDTMELFVGVIRAMDAEYMIWRNDQAERQKARGAK